MSVLLPPPLNPTKAIISPLRTFRLIPFRTSISGLYAKRRFSKVIFSFRRGSSTGRGASTTSGRASMNSNTRSALATLV
ncbi:MAG: hypothetical protein C5S52_00175 [ANME-2 cluster archaeon]|nr:hypothetical protein [ANME-2 cluster archaeon]